MISYKILVLKQMEV